MKKFKVRVGKRVYRITAENAHSAIAKYLEIKYKGNKNGKV